MKRDKVLQVRMSVDELGQVEKWAFDEALPVSVWVRRKLLGGPIGSGAVVAESIERVNEKLPKVFASAVKSPAEAKAVVAAKEPKQRKPMPEGLSTSDRMKWLRENQ
jgi:hypothetical protein